MIEKICEICDKRFKVKNYKKDTARFCSRSCKSAWVYSLGKLVGGNRFEKGNQLRKGQRPTNAFTTEQVKGENSPGWVEPIVIICKTCQAPFRLKPWIVRQNQPRYCSRKCWYDSEEFTRGENNPNYVGGPKTYRGRSWLKARLIAVDRDNGTCQKCGKHLGKSIPVHHIKPFREFDNEAEANKIDNLICLCQSCHMRSETLHLSHMRSCS